MKVYIWRQAFTVTLSPAPDSSPDPDPDPDPDPGPGPDPGPDHNADACRWLRCTSPSPAVPSSTYRYHLSYRLRGRPVAARHR